MSLASKLWNLIAFGTLGPVNDLAGGQTAQVSIGYAETQNNRPVVGLFGLASNPPAGADVVMLFGGGDRSNGVVVGVNHQGSRPTGQAEGETTLYNAHGIKIYLAVSGIVIDGGGLPLAVQNVGNEITMDGTLTLTGGINATGTVAVTGAVTIDGVAVVAP